MTKDYTGPGPARHTPQQPPLDVQAFLDGDLQGRDKYVSLDDNRVANEYTKEWRIPAHDYSRRREGLEAKQYGYFGNCPKCEAEGSSYSPPFGDNWLVCSAGCKVRWLVGAGLFSPPPLGELTNEDLEEIAERLFREYAEVKPLHGWKTEKLPINPDEADVGIRVMRLGEVGGCAICEVDAMPAELRKLADHYLLGNAIGKYAPFVSLSPSAPLCMLCGEEVSRSLQGGVNGMWGLGPDFHMPYATISIRHHDPLAENAKEE